ncbi:MAG: kinase [Lachnospiraceae bacterium]|nr:kinase [Lachnospiraceae bacterium]
MRLNKVKQALDTKRITFTYTEEDGCGSLDFLFRGLSFHVWEYQDGEVWGAETNIFSAGRSEDIEGDYESIIEKEILSWPDMMA